MRLKRTISGGVHEYGERLSTQRDRSVQVDGRSGMLQGGAMW
jgi:hypothetical protein